MLRPLFAALVLIGAVSLPAEAASDGARVRQGTAQRQSDFVRRQHEKHRHSHHHPHKTHQRPWH